MLITKRSPRKSEVFTSRFQDGSGSSFPLRQYLRCREDFSAGIVHLVLQGVFVLALVAFARTVDHLFDSHGAHLAAWYRVGALGVLGLGVLGALYRLVRRVADLKDLRAEMARSLAEFRNTEDTAD